MSERRWYWSALLAAVAALGLGLMAGTVLGAQSKSAATAQDPVYERFEGVRLGMTSDEVRKALGKPREADGAQDFFELSDTRRLRVYYGADGKATALVASFIGKDAGAPPPETILGTSVSAAADGSLSGSASRPERGYRVSYSRTVGDTPMVFITMQAL